MRILRYLEWLKFAPDICESVYELCDDNFKAKKIIDKETAHELIESHNLSLVHRSKHGAIWK